MLDRTADTALPTPPFPPLPTAVTRRRLVLASAAAVVVNACSLSAGRTDGDVVARLRPARYVLIGEVHDNAEHHRLQTEWLAALSTDGRSTCVVFEQMDLGRDDAIAAAPRDAESVATAGRLDRTGWAWPLHRPVLAAALAGGATVRGGNLSREDARVVVQSGAGAVPPAGRALIERSGWRPVDEARVEHDIELGHCGALPPRLVPAMALAERARDATLAAALLNARRSHERVVLIAGNGHVRRDLGVARYLEGNGTRPEDIVAVGLLEAPEADAPYDIVQVTPAAIRPDPCEAFLKR